MKKDKLVEGIKTMLFRYLMGAIEPYGSDELLTELAQAIRDNRKKLGLYTLKDLVLDENKIRGIMDNFNETISEESSFSKQVARAIAKADVIKVKK